MQNLNVRTTASTKGDTLSLLSARGVSKRFGATHALRDVSFEVDRGQVLGLIGENGAGKSTLVKILSGAHRADRGKITLEGQPYAPRGPRDARQAGIAMIYQELNLAPHLSVADNITLGCEPRKGIFLDRATQHQQVVEVLKQLGLSPLCMDTPVCELSLAEQQLVEIARAMVADARVLIFDEPTSSLTQRDVQQLFKVIKRLRDAGLAIIYISHFLEEVREVCDRFVVLRDGQVSGEGELQGTSDEELVTRMVGRSIDEWYPATPHVVGDDLLHLHQMQGKPWPVDVELTLRRGEILGIAGLVGAGRTELLRTIYGLAPVLSGSVRIGQVELGGNPQKSIRAGLGFVSEDRKNEGLAQMQSIADNTTLSHLRPYSRRGWLSLSRRREAVESWIERLAIKAESSNQPVECLSGGNQQKVAIARVLHQDADVLLLDEPTRGIDVGTKAEIYRLIGEQAARGKGIIFVSSYLPELLAVCDRIAVMSRGRVKEIQETQQWTAESVLAVAVAGEEAF